MPAKKQGKLDRSIPFNRWGTNQDEYQSLEEYKSRLKGRPNLVERFKRLDKNANGKLSRQEFGT